MPEARQQGRGPEPPAKRILVHRAEAWALLQLPRARLVALGSVPDLHAPVCACVCTHVSLCVYPRVHSCWCVPVCVPRLTPESHLTSRGVHRTPWQSPLLGSLRVPRAVGSSWVSPI